MDQIKLKWNFTEFLEIALKILAEMKLIHLKFSKKLRGTYRFLTNFNFEKKI